MIRVMIVDDQTVICEGLKVLLNADPEIEVLATAYDGAEALRKAGQHELDVVLMDLNMPVMNGIHATRELRESHPQVKVLVLTTYAQDDWVIDAIRAGAKGYLLKDSHRDEIVGAIKDVMAGKSHIDDDVAEKVLHFVRRGRTRPAEAVDLGLTNRELQILKLLAKGKTNQEIAGELFLALGTVQNYVSNIFVKLNVNDRTQAAAFAWREGLVE